jgi:membrane protease YdiL (CAAX protease family)
MNQTSNGLLQRSLVVIVGGALAVFVLAAFITPWIARALLAFGAEEVEIVKVTVRSAQILAIITTLLALCVFRANTKSAWGLPSRAGLAGRLMSGFAIGVVSLGVGCLLLFVLDVRVTRVDLPTEASYWLNVLWRAALSALFIGVFEELWFRGGLYTLMQQCGGIPLALFGGTTVYAAAHFLDVPEDIFVGASQLHAMIGFESLVAAIQNVFQWQNLDSFVALFIAGLTLSLVRMRQGDVALCIGIHAGWVFMIKVFKKYTYDLTDGPYRALAGYYDDVIGWLVAACLTVLLFCVWRFMRVKPL